MTPMTLMDCWQSGASLKRSPVGSIPTGVTLPAWCKAITEVRVLRRAPRLAVARTVGGSSPPQALLMEA